MYMCHKLPRICSACPNRSHVVFSLMTYHRVCNKSNATGVTCGTGIAYHSGAPEFTQVICMHMRMRTRDKCFNQVNKLLAVDQ